MDVTVVYVRGIRAVSSCTEKQHEGTASLFPPFYWWWCPDDSGYGDGVLSVDTFNYTLCRRRRRGTTLDMHLHFFVVVPCPSFPLSSFRSSEATHERRYYSTRIESWENGGHQGKWMLLFCMFFFLFLFSFWSLLTKAGLAAADCNPHQRMRVQSVRRSGEIFKCIGWPNSTLLLDYLVNLDSLGLTERV